MGERIGDYRVERELTVNSAFASYQARHMLLPRRAVVKVMSTHAQPIAMQGLREAYLLEALQHPGIVRVYESGLLPDRRPWFAREWVEGATISSGLAPGSRDRPRAISLLRDLSEVLAHAHHRGVLHCNLRPDRVLLTNRSRDFPLCIADWSDARAHDAVPATTYLPTAASWHYTSPELACGDAIDDRTDVFSLGVIAYQIMTGTLPFDGVATLVDGTTRHIPTDVHCADAPRELCSIVDQMLAFDRRDRPSSAEVYADLTWLAEALATPAGVVRTRRSRWTPPLNFELRARHDDTIETPLLDQSDRD